MLGNLPLEGKEGGIRKRSQSQLSSQGEVGESSLWMERKERVGKGHSPSNVFSQVHGHQTHFNKLGHNITVCSGQALVCSV